MKYYAGIDPSFAGTAIVILDDKYNIVEEIKFTAKSKNKEKETEEKLLFMWKSIREFISKYDTAEVLFNVEDVIFGSPGQGSIQQAALNYSIRTILLDIGFEFITVAPSQLKKFISGNGAAKKELMLKEVYKKWGVDYNDNDLCDAYCLARYLIDKKIK